MIEVIGIDSLDLATAEGTRKAIGIIVGRFNELVALHKSDQGIDPSEFANLKGAMSDFATKLKNTDDIAKGLARTLGSPGEGVIVHCRSFMKPPDDVAGLDRQYYNVTALDPEELIGAAHLGRDLHPGFSRKIERAFSHESRFVDLVREFQVVNDEVLITAEIMWANGRSAYSRQFNNRIELMRSLKRWKDFQRLATEIDRAINEGTSTQGLNWVPIILSADWVNIVQAELRVAALFPQITMTSNILDNPVLGADTVPYLQAEQTADTGQTAITASQPVLNKTRFTAQKLAVRTIASTESLEDIIVPMVPFILRNIAKVEARGIENACIGGDTAGTMDDAAYNPAGGVRRAWNGLRQQCFGGTSNPATVSAANGNLTRAMLLNVLRKQKIYGAIIGEGAWIVGFSGWAHCLNLPEMITMEKYGPLATVFTGEVGKLFGRPVILSEFLTDDYNASGVHDNVTVDRGELIHVYRSGWALAQRRGVTIAASSERYIEFDQTVFVGTYRGDFESFFPASATVACEGAVYNLAQVLS